MKTNKLKQAKVILVLDAILIGVIGGAAIGLYYTVISNVFNFGHSLIDTLLSFSMVFFPISIILSSFCYGAYKGINGENSFYKFIF